MATLLFSNDKRATYPPSSYAAGASFLPEQPPLRGEARADVCVIGAGYTGLSAALHLAQRGFRVTVLEAHRIGFGASGRNGGQVGSGYNKDQKWLEKTLGASKARLLWDMAEEAKALTRDLATAHAPDAFLSHGVAHAHWHARDVGADHAYADYLAGHYGYDKLERLDARAMQHLIGSPRYQGGTLDHGAAHLDPLAYCLGLGRAALGAGVTICERSTAYHITQGKQVTVQTEQGRIKADHLILAAGGYLGPDLSMQVATRVMPINNFIATTVPLGDQAQDILRQNIAVADDKFVVHYFRLDHKQRLVFGGGESYGYRYPKDIDSRVRKHLAAVFPQLADVAFDHAWGGTLSVTMNRMPYLARLAPNVLSASGYSGHGVALAGLSGRLMAEAITAQAERFDLLASLPARAFPGGPMARQPLLALGMTWYSLRDKLGF
ncbi:Gamma-glutamylputrescine oxidoreductase [Aquimixticola soesokkakensis]|uniref:Gamma-glutamylputrescine oxidoreductase n=1 Tax=Aquimixticola soesokkakensis TaxID=1519096 RepID=A0A1Y5S3K2_9RHOB|nr:FAD-binding oxidoreductase [Aquimixticola soesokkakensis]SLN31921.1 Gamma-glutamylputrescine oxidoreductase [Aquimixticola soesokkakensis]